ncbi:hypothetical protein CV102_22555 [Natronococcus pandeyae]|uniref:Uncharacterized protein n=1 Tax=Natronococcus pandeyae TaxID=2055836 RepID=A0A8J8Q091_9EURY|nr:hypothetical protein [Natronococcus pandeyae]TYL36409.1 hypothetical protein CV102_22555 [Natronococcus pandeyae]
MTHFALGIVFTALLVQVFIPDAKYKRTVIFFGGAWALLPDLYRLSPAFDGALRQLPESRLADLFWFHWTLNQYVTGTEFRYVGAFTIGVLFVVLFGIELHDAIRKQGDAKHGHG